MRSGECPLPKINAEGRGDWGLLWEKGSIEWVSGLFFLLFLTLLLCAQLQAAIWHTTSLYLEDALAASNLASAVIDLEEYGISHIIRIEDPREAYSRYLDAVRENLQLDENWECPNRALISGKVSIDDYIIYNVQEEKVVIFHVSENGHSRMEQGILGSVKAPNGVLVEATGIYSEISFPVEGILGITVQAHKGKLVDVVTDESCL